MKYDLRSIRAILQSVGAIHELPLLIEELPLLVLHGVNSGTITKLDFRLPSHDRSNSISNTLFVKQI
jgi:hypothetical protein